MNIALWVIQTLLALFFAQVSLVHLFQPLDKLAAQFGWVKNAPPSPFRVIGGCELAGLLG